jgi:hypothetical protein
MSKDLNESLEAIENVLARFAIRERLLHGLGIHVIKVARPLPHLGRFPSFLNNLLVAGPGLEYLSFCIR